LTVHRLDACVLNDQDDQQIAGVADFYKFWPASHVAVWPGSDLAELSMDDNEGRELPPFVKTTELMMS
jgi:hypothetical protein